MPNYFEADKDISLVVPFIVDGDYATPDVGSVFVTVRDNAGVVMISSDPVVTDEVTTSIQYSIPSAKNSLGSLTSAHRTVAVDFKVSGKQFTHRIGYVITPFLNFYVSPDDVRGFVGLDAGEYPDGDMDLPGAYLALADRVGAAALASQLSAGGIAAQEANAAVKYKAVLASIPALRLRVAAKRTIEGQSEEKMKIDFDQMVHHLEMLLSQWEKKYISTATSATPTLLAVGSRTDMITGA